ncbi:MAG: hypothetical protein ABIG95_01315 [Candidatus Woesearchaeota archaeon]
MRKAQMKMFETIGVLIVFFFILSIGLVFYYQFQKTRYAAGKGETFQLRTMNIIQQVNYLPELQCSFDNIASYNCFDIAKVMAFTDISAANKAYYHHLFVYSNITVQEIYPLERNWNLFYSKPESWKELSRNQIPILLFNSTQGRYYAGVLVVEVYI